MTRGRSVSGRRIQCTGNERPKKASEQKKILRCTPRFVQSVRSIMSVRCPISSRNGASNAIHVSTNCVGKIVLSDTRPLLSGRSKRHTRSRRFERLCRRYLTSPFLVDSADSYLWHTSSSPFLCTISCHQQQYGIIIEYQSGKHHAVQAIENAAVPRHYGARVLNFDGAFQHRLT